MEDGLEKLYTDSGIVKEGHFKLNSGMHSGVYVDKNAITLDPLLYSLTVTLLIDIVDTWMMIDGNDADIITGPPTAGSHIASAIAAGCTTPLGFIYPEKRIGGEFYFRPTFQDILHGKKIIIVEDIATTGNSIRKLIQLLEKYGARTYGVFGIWNRGSFFEDGHFLVSKSIPKWFSEDCPLCSSGVPLTSMK